MTTGEVICGQLLRKHLEILLLLEDCVQFLPLQPFCFCHSSFSCLHRKRKALHLFSPILDKGFVTRAVGGKQINVKILLFYILAFFKKKISVNTLNKLAGHLHEHFT